MCIARWSTRNARLRRDRATSSMASGTGTAYTRMRMAGGSRASGSTTRSTAGASRSTRAATATRASGWTARSTGRCALAVCVCTTLPPCWSVPAQLNCVRGIAGHAVVRWGRSVPGRVEGRQDARTGHLHLRRGRQASLTRLTPGRGGAPIASHRIASAPRPALLRLQPAAISAYLGARPSHAPTSHDLSGTKAIGMTTGGMGCSSAASECTVSANASYW